MKGTRPYLISLHQSPPGGGPSRPISERPPHRVAFTVQPGDGTVHWYEGTLTVDELFVALKPVLRERIEVER